MFHTRTRFYEVTYSVASFPCYRKIITDLRVFLSFTVNIALSKGLGPNKEENIVQVIVVDAPDWERGRSGWLYFGVDTSPMLVDKQERLSFF